MPSFVKTINIFSWVIIEPNYDLISARMTIRIGQHTRVYINPTLNDFHSLSNLIKRNENNNRQIISLHPINIKLQSGCENALEVD